MQALPSVPAPWDEYVDLLRVVWWTQCTDARPGDDQLRAELYRQFAMNIALGYFMYFQSDASHPDWTPFLNSVFLLQPNPDDTYFHAYVDAAGTYRIVGERGSVRLLTMSMGRAAMGTGDRPGPSLRIHRFRRPAARPERRIELLLSRERPAGHTGHWIALHPEADYLLLRTRSYDWGRERDPRIAIERLDAPAVRPRMSKQQIDRRLREVLGGFPTRLSAMWLNYQKSVLRRA